MPIIQVENLSKYYGSVHAVDRISFEVEAGSLFGFLGVNGAGKSTTIHMLSTLLTPTQGTAQICGKLLGKDNCEIRQKIGIVYQQNCLDELLTVEENLMSRGYLYEKNPSKNKAKLTEVCQVLELKDLRKLRYRKLSGGQKRRYEIAAALMHTPEILFLDEPTTGLDPATRKSVWSAVHMLQKSLGMTVFLTTHYMEEAAESSQIVIIDSGKLIAGGTPFELKERYASDMLRLYSEDPDTLSKKLEGKAVFQKKGNALVVPIKHTVDSLSLLEEVREFIKGFEVLQGTMDDVFLNISGKSLTEEDQKFEPARCLTANLLCAKSSAEMREKMRQTIELIKRNFKLYYRDKSAVSFSLLTMLIVVALMVLFLGDMNINNLLNLLEQMGVQDPDTGREHVKILILLWTLAGIIAMNSITVPVSILGNMFQDQSRGRFKSFYTSPVSRTSIGLGYIGASVLGSVFVCLITLGITDFIAVLNGAGIFSLLTHGKIFIIILVNSFCYFNLDRLRYCLLSCSRWIVCA